MHHIVIRLDRNLLTQAHIAIKPSLALKFSETILRIEVFGKS